MNQDKRKSKVLIYAGAFMAILIGSGYDLGMGVTYLDPGSSQMGKKESIADTAKVLGRFYDGIEYRGFDQDLVEELGANAGVPVWMVLQINGTQHKWSLICLQSKKTLVN